MVFFGKIITSIPVTLTVMLLSAVRSLFFVGQRFISDASNIEDPRWSDIVKKPRLISCLAKREIQQDFRGVSHPVIKHGLLENPNLAHDFQIKPVFFSGFPPSHA